MRKLFTILLVLLVTMPCFAASPYYMYMAPVATGNGTGVDSTDEANDFNMIMTASWKLSNTNSPIDVCMATGTYNMNVNQNFDPCAISPLISGKTWVFNYLNISGVNVIASRYMYFHNYSSPTAPNYGIFTPSLCAAANYIFNDINFVSSKSDSMFQFDANAGTSGHYADSLRTFNGCQFSVPVGAGIFPPVSICGEIDLNQCTLTTNGSPIFWGQGNVDANVTNSTFTNYGTSPCVELGYGDAGDTLVFTATGSTFNEPNTTALTYAILESSSSFPVLSLTNCTIEANSLGYGTGIYIVSPVWTYIKHCNFNTPSSAILQYSLAANVLIDDCNLDVNAPTRLMVAGTWVSGDTIQIWIQKGLNTSSHTFTVGAGRTTSAQVIADFITDWNANADAFCKTIVASNIGDSNIILNGTSAWQTMTPVINGVSGAASSGGGTIVNMADFEYGPTVKLPYDPIVLDGNNVLLKNCVVDACNGMPWEGINVNGITYGGGVTVQNCRVKDCFFGIVCRALNALVDSCISQANWPYLVESGATKNTIKNCTLYGIEYPDFAIGVLNTGSGNKAVNNLAYNNICVANSSLVNMGTGSLPTTPIYCIFDYQKYIGGNFFDRNDYWTIGSYAKDANMQNYANMVNNYTTEYTTLASMLTAWPTIGANSMSALNDLHSINADPQFKDVNGGDFSLLPSSPCINAGVLIPAGGKTTIGAYQPPYAPATIQQNNVNPALYWLMRKR